MFARGIIAESYIKSPVHLVFYTLGLLSFQSKDILSSAVNYRLCHPTLTAYIIDSYDAVLQFKNTQQAWYGGYLVTLAGDLLLCQQQIVRRSPCAYPRNRSAL